MKASGNKLKQTQVLRTPICAFFRSINCPKCTLNKVNMADSNWSESTSTSGCDHSDFEASMKGENNDRA